MPEKTEERESLSIWRKRLRYRSWHRGTKELDLLLGSFADRHLDTFDQGQLARLEILLEVPEPVIQSLRHRPLTALRERAFASRTPSAQLR